MDDVQPRAARGLAKWNGSVSAEAELTRLKLDLPNRLHSKDVIGTVGRARNLEHAYVPVGGLSPDQGDVPAVAVAPILLPPRPKAAGARRRADVNLAGARTGEQIDAFRLGQALDLSGR